MTVRNLFIEAELDTIPDVVNIAPRTVVAVPPSAADPLWDEMRVAINRRISSRAFDPGAPIVTGAPVGLLTEAGDTLTTESGDRLITEVRS